MTYGNDQMKSERVCFLIYDQSIHCGYSLELPHWGGSNVYPENYVLSKKKKKMKIE